MSRCSVWFKYWENWYSTSMICSMQLMYSLPQLVSRIGEQERSKIGLPMRFSTFLTMALSAGCEINSFSAAREKLISLYTAYTYSILRNMRTPPRKVYHKHLIISNIKKQYLIYMPFLAIIQTVIETSGNPLTLRNPFGCNMNWNASCS